MRAICQAVLRRNLTSCSVTMAPSCGLAICRVGHGVSRGPSSLAASFIWLITIRFTPIEIAEREFIPRPFHCYFTDGHPIRCEGSGTYAAPLAKTEHNVTYQWQHTIQDIVCAASSVRDCDWNFCTNSLRAYPITEQKVSGTPDAI